MPDTNRLTHDEVRAIAELAKLALSDEEVATYAEQLSEILQAFQELRDADTSQIEPTASVLPVRSVMRPDVVESPLSPDAATANAPRARSDQFHVAAVLGDDASS